MQQERQLALVSISVANVLIDIGVICARRGRANVSILGLVNVSGALRMICTADSKGWFASSVNLKALLTLRREVSPLDDDQLVHSSTVSSTRAKSPPDTISIETCEQIIRKSF